jgi:ribonucleoside-diphosphate reductase alpha chain
MKTWKWKQGISEEIFNQKYALRGETIEEAIKEISYVMSHKERGKKENIYKQKFVDLMMARKFVPAGRIWSNARKDDKVKNYSNCFTIPIEDSMTGIYDALKYDALLGKVGGGVGLDISTLRPKADKISKGGSSSGAVSFLRVFNESAKIIQTGGGRRAAHIALMKIDHPDIEEFITAKRGDENKSLTQFNISVKVSRKFMDAVEKDLDWDLVFNKKVYKTVKAKYLYDLIMKNMYLHNEPGIFFEDEVERYNNAKELGLKLDSVNPCGELTLPSQYGACQLGHMFLTSYIKETPLVKNSWFDFDFESFRKDVKIAVRFLDNAIDVQEYPLEQTNQTAKDWRRIGLGFMGLADTMAILGYKYGDRNSKIFAIKMSKTLRDASYEASMELAVEKGKFPKCDNKRLCESNFIKKLPKELRDGIRKNGLRNIGLNTVAPTGTISLSVGGNCSSGIEPIFALSYNRNIRTGNGDETKKEKVYNGAWFDYIESQKKKGIKEEDIKIPEPFKSTVENGNINVFNEIEIQGLIQRYIDHSISKTCNIPKGTNFEEYNKIFKFAYKLGLKGFTTFNPEGSVRGVLEFKEKEESTRLEKTITYIKELESCDCNTNNSPPRPEELPCDIYESKSMGQEFLVIIGIKENCPYEIFVGDNTKGNIDVENFKHGIVRKVTQGRYDLIVIPEKNGEQVLIENITKTISHDAYGTLARFLSMSLRHNVPVQFIVDQLTKDSQFISFERAVARVLKKYIKEGEVAIGMVCPKCGSTQMIYKDKCPYCLDCNYTKCS